ncbi:hypothetical protein PC9H_002786 [Pleurotus ostreatus]|uniref:Uncharacterized protein n=1 Tax=Pleurotus ostreatus TaxID=5322 RepID=A0A8H6ZGH5_PLEOS|nr:uncharacterized protein PC9H_002786 [Pleurotus ostreatus]KAF7416042.1 hypothetical protein PC9H_002786 [Pleurotus ostreatus]
MTLTWGFCEHTILCALDIQGESDHRAPTQTHVTLARLSQPHIPTSNGDHERWQQQQQWSRFGRTGMRIANKWVRFPDFHITDDDDYGNDDRRLVPPPMSNPPSSPMPAKKQSIFVVSCRRLENALSAVSGQGSNSSTAGSSPNVTPSAAVHNPDAARALILEYEERVAEAEQARDEAEARRRMVVDNWQQLERYLQGLEFHASDARAGFARISLTILIFVYDRASVYQGPTPKQFYRLDGIDKQSYHPLSLIVLTCPHISHIIHLDPTARKWRQPPPPSNVAMPSRRYSPPPQPIPPPMEYRATRSGRQSQVEPGPLPQPGQVQTYQTHVFAPVVTGAPVKKSKFGASGSSGNLTANGSQSQGDVNGVQSAPPPPSFPPTNAQSQRICRQCGFAWSVQRGKALHPSHCGDKPITSQRELRC